MRWTGAEQRRELYRLTIVIALDAAARPENFEIRKAIESDLNDKMNIFMDRHVCDEEFKLRIEVKDGGGKAIPMNAHTEACLMVLKERVKLGGDLETEEMDELEYIISDDSISDADKANTIANSIAKSGEFNDPGNQ